MEIGKELENLGLYLRRQRSRYMESFGLKGIQTQLLLEISNQPGISQDQLAAITGVDKSNVARQLAILEQYIERQPVPGNRRKFQLQLKERALRLLPRLQKAEEHWEQNLLQELSRWEVSQFSALLSRIRQAAEEK